MVPILTPNAPTERKTNIQFKLPDYQAVSDPFSKVVQKATKPVQKATQEDMALIKKAMEKGLSKEQAFQKVKEFRDMKAEAAKPTQEEGYPTVLTKGGVQKMKDEMKPTDMQNFKSGFVSGLPSGIASLRPASPMETAEGLAETALEGAPETVRKAAGIIGKGAKALFGDTTLSTPKPLMAVGKRITKAGEQLSEAVSRKEQLSKGYQPESGAGKLGKFAGEVAPTLLAGAVTGKVLTPGAKAKLGTSSEKKAMDILKPKEFSGKQLEELKKAGKVQTGKGLLGEGVEYVPDARDMQIAKTAAPYLRKGASTSENISSLRNAISSEAQRLEDTLKANNPIIPKQRVSQYVSNVTDEVMSHPEMVGDNQKVAMNLINKYKAIQNEEGGTALGILRARKRFDEYVSSVKPKTLGSEKGTVYDSTVRAIRNGANDLLDSIASDAKVKESLRMQRELYNAIDMLAPQKDIGILGKILRSGAGKAVTGGIIGATGYDILTR